MAACRNYAIILLAGVLSVGLPCCLAVSLRGLDPALESLYTPSDGTFKCLDGTKIMPLSQVNDGYCDCTDGTDEPGEFECTSACSNGKFYCPNLGSEPLRLNASFVDDGICDCCDGSDEATGLCTNRCKEAGLADLAALEAELKDYEEGLKIKARYIKAAESMRLSWNARLEEIDELTRPSQLKADSTSAERTRLETQLQALEAKKDKLEEALKPALAEPSSDDEEEFLPEDSNASDEVSEGTESEKEEQAQDEEQEPKEESAEELAKRVASQWIPGASGNNNDPDNSYEVEEGVDDGADESEPEDADDINNSAQVDESEDDLTPEERAADEEALKGINLGLVGGVKAWIAGVMAQLRGKEADEAELEQLRVAVESLRKHVDAARKAANTAMDYVTNLNNERMGLNAKIERTYGPSDVYAQLADRCIETKADKYTYKICPYNKAEQVEHHSGTSLGSWQGFDDSGDHMKFQNGDYCWQGPNRSMTVRIRCGSTEIVGKVAEPSRCEYTAEMTSPAACSEEGVAALRAAVETKKALLSAVKDEL